MRCTASVALAATIAGGEEREADVGSNGDLTGKATDMQKTATMVLEKRRPDRHPGFQHCQ